MKNIIISENQYKALMKEDDFKEMMPQIMQLIMSDNPDSIMLGFEILNQQGIDMGQKYLQALFDDYRYRGSFAENWRALRKIKSLAPSSGVFPEFPEILTYLSQLKRIDLRNNGISKLPDSLGNLTNLHTLILKGNNLSRLPDSIGNLTNLLKLDLSYNQLTELPSSIGNLAKLTDLVINDNGLQAIPSSIGGLSSLIDLDLADNKLTEIPEEIQKLGRLEDLNLSNNQLTGPPRGIVRMRYHLEYLDVSGNPFVKKPYVYSFSVDRENSLKLMLPTTKIKFR